MATNEISYAIKNIMKLEEMRKLPVYPELMMLKVKTY
jgi:hypothetical protein